MLKHLNREARNPARVVVLGSNGFVGRELIQHLAKMEIDVLCLGRDRIDLAAYDAKDKLVAELRSDDTLVFLAALTPDKGRGIPPFLDNLKMGSAVCAAIEAKPVAHVVYLSSDAVYPFRAGLVDETTPAESVDLYAAMHIAREIMVRQATKAPVAILRPTMIYGAADTHNSYGPNRLRRMARKECKIILFGEGEETRDHIYIDDVVALLSLVIYYRSEGLLNLASGYSISYAQLARLVASHFPCAVEIKGTLRENPITHRTFDISALHRAFPSFRFTSLQAGLALAHQNEAA